MALYMYICIHIYIYICIHVLFSECGTIIFVIIEGPTVIIAHAKSVLDRGPAKANTPHLPSTLRPITKMLFPIIHYGFIVKNEQEFLRR